MNPLKVFRFSIVTLFFLILGGCSNHLISEADAFYIGVIGPVEQFDFDNVTYDSILVEDLLTDQKLKEKYTAIMIHEQNFETVSEIEYIKQFEAFQMSIIFVDSAKGHNPFIRPFKNLDWKKPYSEYNDYPQKMTVMLTYPLPALNASYSTTYKHDETLTRDRFIEIIEHLSNR